MCHMIWHSQFKTDEMSQECFHSVSEFMSWMQSWKQVRQKVISPVQNLLLKNFHVVNIKNKGEKNPAGFHLNLLCSQTYWILELKRISSFSNFKSLLSSMKWPVVALQAEVTWRWLQVPGPKSSRVTMGQWPVMKETWCWGVPRSHWCPWWPILQPWDGRSPSSSRPTGETSAWVASEVLWVSGEWVSHLMCGETSVRASVAFTLETLLRVRPCLTLSLYDLKIGNTCSCVVLRKK